MTKLFVANPTKQYQEVHYRLDLNEKGSQEPLRRFQPAKRMTIAPGRQVALGGDLHISQAEDIISQLRPYGAVAVQEVARLRTVTSYIYSTDRPVPADVLRRVMDINAGILVEQGKERRERGAIVANEAVTNVVGREFAEAGIPKEPEQKLDVEFEQLETSEAGEKRVEEGYRIDHKAQAKSGKGRKR